MPPKCPKGPRKNKKNGVCEPNGDKASTKKNPSVKVASPAKKGKKPKVDISPLPVCPKCNKTIRKSYMKKLPCGHMLHEYCFLQHCYDDKQNDCPVCHIEYKKLADQARVKMEYLICKDANPWAMC